MYWFPVFPCLRGCAGLLCPLPIFVFFFLDGPNLDRRCVRTASKPSDAGEDERGQGRGRGYFLDFLQTLNCTPIQTITSAKNIMGGGTADPPPPPPNPPNPPPPPRYFALPPQPPSLLLFRLFL